MDEAQTTALTQVLDQRFGVESLWLFGSTATGRATPDSDLDLAVLFRTRPTVIERLELESELARLAGKPVDLIDLDAASPALAMQVLRHGQLLVDRNPARRITFTARAPARYDDLRRLRAPIERKIAERMNHGRT
jgi:predicted nucleotidyltransferase